MVIDQVHVNRIRPVETPDDPPVAETDMAQKPAKSPRDGCRRKPGKAISSGPVAASSANKNRVILLRLIRSHFPPVVFFEQELESLVSESPDHAPISVTYHLPIFSRVDRGRFIALSQNVLPPPPGSPPTNHPLAP